MKIAVGSDICHYTRSVGQFDNRMSYVVGLKELGHEVFVIAEANAARCLDDAYQPVSFEEWEGRTDFPTLAKAYGESFPYCIVYQGGASTYGMTFDEAVDHAGECDLLLNIGGKVTTRSFLERIPCKALLDLAPGKTQVYENEYGLDQGLSNHDFFFTVGLNIGSRTCRIPTCGLKWQGFVHPVPLPLWPPAVSPTCHGFTTISGWAGKETFVYDGTYSGEKSEQWLEFIDLPGESEASFEIALDLAPGHEEDAERFRSQGWVISDPKALRDLTDYQRFVASSDAEFTIANQRYVGFRSGWFSERSARYLASGKPVLMQSTGVEDHLPTGSGLLTFATFEEAIEGAETIRSDYEDHCRAARKLAEDHFDSRKVLARVLNGIGPV